LDLGLRGPAALLVGLVLFELCGYAYHRAAHGVPALWRLHAVHHSAPQMHWLAAYRQHPVEIVVMTTVQNLPLVLLGMPIGAHALVIVLLMLNSVFVHSNLRIDHPWLRCLIATPRFHHRHHDRDAQPANFAALLPILDRVFGSYAGERAARFGVSDPHPAGFWALLVWPFSAIARRKNASGRGASNIGRKSEVTAVRSRSRRPRRVCSLRSSSGRRRAPRWCRSRRRPCRRSPTRA
jgi:hypothetical protein